MNKLIQREPDALQVARGEMALRAPDEYPEGTDVREQQVIDVWRAMWDAAPQVDGVPPEGWQEVIASQCQSLDKIDINQPGWHWRSGWNEALRHLAAIFNATAAAPQPAQAQEDTELKELLKEIADFPEINAANYSHDDVAELNNWGVMVWERAEELRKRAAAHSQPAAQEQEKDAVACLRAVKEWDVGDYIKRGGFALPPVLRAMIDAALSAHTKDSE
jgi:plasmid stabilization system protein ParE